MALRTQVSGVVTFLLISASSQVREKKGERERKRERERDGSGRPKLVYSQMRLRYVGWSVRPFVSTIYRVCSNVTLWLLRHDDPCCQYASNGYPDYRSSELEAIASLRPPRC